MLSVPGLFLLLTALLPGGATPSPDTVTAFVNIAVVPMDREQVLTGQTVIVQNGRIAAIGPAGKVAVPAGAVRVDGKGKWLIPGLADMHAHFGSLSTEALAPYLATGVTTIREMGTHRSAEEFQQRDRLRRGEVLGPRVYLATPHVNALESPQDAVALVNDSKAAGYDLIKIYSPVVDSLTVDSLVAAARRAKLLFGGHTPIGIPLEMWLKAGPVTIEHLEGYWQVWVRKYFESTGTESDPNTVQFSGVLEEIQKTEGRALDDSALTAVAVATKRAGVWNVPTSTIYHVLDMGRSPELHRLVEQLRNRIIKALHDAGAGLLVGTDRPPTEGTVHTELQLLVEAGLSPYEALAAGTRNVAQALGTLDSTGTVEVGKRADLVVLTGDPLQDIRHTASIGGVVMAGRWLPRAELDSLAPPPPKNSDEGPNP